MSRKTGMRPTLRLPFPGAAGGLAVLAANTGSTKQEGKQLRNALSTTIIAIAVAAVCTPLAAQQPRPAPSTEYFQTFCETSWDRSEAQEYCPDPVIDWHRNKGRVQCGVRATCTVNVRVGDSEQEFREELSKSSGNLKDLTLCFRSKRNADGNLDWSMSMHGYCGSATDVTTAVLNGLPAR